MVDLYYNDDHSCYAVLVSHGFGAGWSSWNSEEIAYDKRVIEWYLEHNSYEFCNKVNLYSSFSSITFKFNGKLADNPNSLIVF